MLEKAPRSNVCSVQNRQIVKRADQRIEQIAGQIRRGQYGYRWDGQRLIVVPEEAEIVKKIYELYLSGNGVSHITSFLNKKGFTVGEKQWNSNRVRYILGNEKYIGDCMLQKTYNPFLSNHQ